MELRCSETGDRLEIAELSRDRHGELESFRVRFAGSGMEASSRIYGPISDDPSAFFGGLAEHWRGWEGGRSCAPGDPNFHMIATADGRGHVRLSIRLARSQWVLESIILLEAGQLDEIAAEAAALFGVNRA